MESNTQETYESYMGEASGEVLEPLLGVVTPEPEVPETPRVRLLQEAASLITGDRQEEYGPPSLNFQRIVDIWKVLIPEVEWNFEKVCLALLGLKMARAAQVYKHDTFVDIAGYSALLVELVEGSNA